MLDAGWETCEDIEGLFLGLGRDAGNGEGGEEAMFWIVRTASMRMVGIWRPAQ